MTAYVGDLFCACFTMDENAENAHKCNQCNDVACSEVEVLIICS